ncbi:YdeI/OmpD-associated family protein [Pontibacter sp. CAU 1760]
MPELYKKLQLKPGHTLLLLHAPKEIEVMLQESGTNVTSLDTLPTSSIYDAVLVFVGSTQQVEQDAASALVLLQPEGVLWIAYPKKTSGIKTDLTRDKGWEAMAALGYEPVRQVAIDEVWSALRFRPRAERKATSMFGVDLPGIDRKTKTVTVPDDMQQALEEAEVVDVFNQLAFTHRKEYVVAVLQAKRPETRASRIQKVVAQLRRKQEA